MQPIIFQIKRYCVSINDIMIIIIKELENISDFTNQKIENLLSDNEIERAKIGQFIHASFYLYKVF